MLRDHYIGMCLCWMAESGANQVSNVDIVWTVNSFDCMSSSMSSKDQSQSYTMTAEGTDLSTDMLSIDGDQLQVELDKDSTTESGSDVLVFWSCWSAMRVLADCCKRCQKNFQCASCAFIYLWLRCLCNRAPVVPSQLCYPTPLFSTEDSLILGVATFMHSRVLGAHEACQVTLHYHKLLQWKQQILCGTVVSSGYNISLQSLTMWVGKGSALIFHSEHSTTVKLLHVSLCIY